MKNAIFTPLLSHFFGFWRALAIWIWKGYSSEILNFWLQNMKKNMQKFTGSPSTHMEMSKSYPSFFMFCLKKRNKRKFWKKKWWENLYFWLLYTNRNCFSWHFKLKTYCLLLFYYIRPFSGPFIGPRMQLIHVSIDTLRLILELKSITTWTRRVGRKSTLDIVNKG